MHNKLKDITNLSDQDWSHVHITERALTFDGTTYSLKTDLSAEMELPKLYFGETSEEKKEADDVEASEQESVETNSYLTDEEAEDPLGEWAIQSAQIMPMTTAMVAVGHRSHKEFAFVVKPSPGCKKLDLVAF